MLHHLAEQQQSLLDQLVVTQAQISQQLWDQVNQAMRPGTASASSGEPGRCPAIHIPKMTTDDDPEAFLNAYEWSVWMAGWAENQWAFILIPCLVGSAQQVIDTMPVENVGNYKVKEAILQTLNLSLEAYHWQLQEIRFGADY